MLEGLQKLADDISTLAIEVIAMEWRAQGHELTGSAVKQMETFVKFEINTLIIEGLVPDYMAINNQGVQQIRYHITQAAEGKQVSTLTA